MWILLFRFFVIFPEPKRISRSRLVWLLIAVSLIGLIGFLIAELIMHPVLYYTTGSVAGPLLLIYALLILAALVHTLVKTSRTELSRSGMWLILAGLLLTIATTSAALFSGMSLPGWLTALLVLPTPLSMALAVRKQARVSPSPGSGSPA
jgi:hypothetical protein